MKQAEVLGEKEGKAPEYYQHGYWKTWSRVYDFTVKLSFIPFGGENRFRRKVVDLASVKEGEQVLDLCCGTGTLTSLIAKKVGNNGRVTGIDLSEDMINRAKSKVTNLPVTFKQASADKLPFEEGAFDKAFISYGMHEMPDEIRLRAMKELYRVLKPGSSLFIVDYNLPGSPLPRLAIGLFLRTFEEKVAYKMARDGVLPDQLKEAGFTVVYKKLPLGGMFQIISADKSL